MSEAITNGVWTAFRGAGLLTIGGLAALTEAGTLLTLKIVGLTDPIDPTLQQIRLITLVACTAIALGAALLVTAALSVTGGYLLAGAAALVLPAEVAEKFYLIATLAVAAYTFYCHYCAYQWSRQPL